LDSEVKDLVALGEDIREVHVLGTRDLKESKLNLLDYSYAGYPLMDCPGIYWPPRARCDQNPCCQVLSDADEYLKFRTVRRFKGMESKIVILIVDKDTVLDYDENRRLLYVGLTRARIRLIVLADKAHEHKLNRMVEGPLAPQK